MTRRKSSRSSRTCFRTTAGSAESTSAMARLIFALPPAEVAVHPSDTNGRHELYLMTENLEVFVAAMGARGIGCTPPQDQGWGVVTSVTLPGGGTLGVYEPGTRGRSGGRADAQAVILPALASAALQTICRPRSAIGLVNPGPQRPHPFRHRLVERAVLLARRDGDFLERGEAAPRGQLARDPTTSVVS